MTYFAVVQMASSHDFRIQLPDFPDVEVSCSSLVEAQHKADRAVREALSARMRGGGDAPRPSPREEIESVPEYKSAFLVQVDVQDVVGGPAGA